MNNLNRARLFTVLGSLTFFAACGGGGGGTASSPAAPASGQSSTPAPPAAPPSPPVVIFANPTPQTYAALGSRTHSAGDGYTPVAPGARLSDVSLEAGDQPLLRYTASAHYEIQLPGRTFDRLVHYKGLADPTSSNNFFQPAGVPQNRATFITSLSSLDGYQYSELAGWTDGNPPVDSMGIIAFGSPTPSASIPGTGTATYSGRFSGVVDITYFDYLYGGNYFSSVGGSVTLTVDFAARTVEGTVDFDPAEGFPDSIALSSTAFMPGDDSWWGMFGTSEPGFNEFKLKLTGPDATELIGGFALPIVVDGESHQLMGAWIAAR